MLARKDPAINEKAAAAAVTKTAAQEPPKLALAVPLLLRQEKYTPRSSGHSFDCNDQTFAHF